jgi:hypothetical protein
MKIKIEKRRKFTPEDVPRNLKPKHISPILDNTKEMETSSIKKTGVDWESADKDDREQLTGWRRIMADYEDRIHLIKDDCTFIVHGK